MAGRIPQTFIDERRRALRYRRDHRRAGSAEEGRARIQSLLPVPQREIALFLGQSGQAVLPLLRLRGARHRRSAFSCSTKRWSSSTPWRTSRSAPASNCRARRTRRPRSGRRRSARGHGARPRVSSSKTWRTMPRAQKYVRRARHRCEDRREHSALGYAPDSWDALLNRFGAAEEERRRLLQLGLIIERDTRGGERAAGFYDRFRDRLMFPIRDSRGRVIGFGGSIIDQGEPKYLNSPETPLVSQGPRTVWLVRGAAGAGGFQAADDRRGLYGRGSPASGRDHLCRGDPGHGDHPGAPEQDLQADQRSGVLLRRRSRRPPGGVAGPGECPAAGARRTRAEIHVPARGA